MAFSFLGKEALQMFYYLPVLGAVALAGGTILEKIVLIKRKINIKLYHTSAFLAIVISMLPLIYFFWKINAAAWQLKNIIIFLFVILFAMIANLLFFYSLKWEKIGNIEPARVLEPLFIILLAVVFSFFAEGLYERSARIVIPALIAGSVLVFSHIEKHHLEFNKYFIATILGSFFFALELVISRLILNFYSPVTFYFLRSSSIFLLSLIIFKPKFGKLSTKVRWTILATGAIWMAYRVLLYYGYLNVGVVSTTLLLMLGPIFIYIFAFFFLKEKIRWKNFAAAIVIVGAIIYAITG